MTRQERQRLREFAQDLIMEWVPATFEAAEEQVRAGLEPRELLDMLNSQVRRIDKLFGYEPGTHTDPNL